MAERFLEAESPLEAARCAVLSATAEAALWRRAAGIFKAAGEIPWPAPDRPSEDLERCREYFRMLEARLATEQQIRQLSAPPPLAGQSLPTICGSPSGRRRSWPQRGARREKAKSPPCVYSTRTTRPAATKMTVRRQPSIVRSGGLVRPVSLRRARATTSP
jgi:hypothetical protein